MILEIYQLISFGLGGKCGNIEKIENLGCEIIFLILDI